LNANAVYSRAPASVEAILGRLVAEWMNGRSKRRTKGYTAGRRE